MSGIVLSLPYSGPSAPLMAFAPYAGQHGAVLLDSAASGDPRGRWSYLCVDPCLVMLDNADSSPIPSSIPQETRQDPFAGLAELCGRLQDWAQHKAFLDTAPWGQDRPPFIGGVVGWLTYDAGRHLERLPPALPDDLGVPEAVFGLYDVVVAFDALCSRAWLIAWPGAEGKAQRIVSSYHQALAAGPMPPPSQTAFSLVADQTRSQAETAIATVIEAIFAGEIFQANVTQRFVGDLPETVSPWDLYRRLRARSAAPFAAMASFGGAHLLSASPERFLAVDCFGGVESRPIKGTRRRGQTPEDDRALAQELVESEKDRAENLMIVDLLRNDLSRVCAIGSVRVPALCAVETFASVHHLVSEVRGRLRPEATSLDLLRASFPGGSITGAPKIHAMEILNSLEPCRRGLYCGSLFWMGVDGAFDSSILIRSLVVGRSGRVAAQAGGGIVSDSDPAAEWEEAMTKVAPLLRAADLADATPSFSR